jgi:hypothetical protein
MHHPEVQALVGGEKLYRSVKTPEGNWTEQPLSPRKEFHIRQVNQAAGYSDQPGLAWETRRPAAGLSEEAKYASVPASKNFYTLDESLDDLTQLQQAGARNPDFIDEVYLRSGANTNDALTSLGERSILVSDQGRINDRFRQEWGDSVPQNVQDWHDTPVRSVMPESDALDFAPQNRFAQQRNLVPLPPQTISSPQEQAAIRAGLEADAPRTLGGFTMNTRSVRVGDMPSPQPIEGAYLPVGKGYQQYTPSADLNQRSEEMSNLLIDVGGQKVPYVSGATAEIAGHELVRDPDIMPDAIEAISQQRQKAARIRGQAGVSDQSPTAPSTRPMWKNADQALDELNAGANTLRSVQAYDPAHNISSQGFDVTVDVAPGEPTIRANYALTRHGLAVDVGGTGMNNVLSASGELPVEKQVELARSLRSIVNPTGGMMGLADADPEMAGLREHWKQQRESAIVDRTQQAKVDAAIAQVRAQNGLGVLRPPSSPRQSVEVLNQQDISAMRPIARRTRRVDDDWLGVGDGPSMADLGLPVAQPNFVITSDTSLPPQSPVRSPRTAAEVFYQQNYAVPQGSQVMVAPQPGAYLSPNPSQQRSAAGALPQQPNWIIPSAIAGGVLGTGALGYMAYNSRQEEEARKRQAAR